MLTHQLNNLNIGSTVNIHIVQQSNPITGIVKEITPDMLVLENEYASVEPKNSDQLKVKTYIPLTNILYLDVLLNG